MARKPRHLSAEDREIWKQVTRTLTPMKPSKMVPPDPARTWPVEVRRPVADPEPFDISARLAARGRGTTAAPAQVSLVPDPMTRARSAPLQMDAKTFGRMKRGKVSPDARIDLHGMTADRAHAALRGFLLGAFARGQRLVLVITGKGRMQDHDDRIAPHRRGILRHAVPDWLDQAPLSQIVLQLAPAHARHGGSGAYYVYLRRNG